MCRGFYAENKIAQGVGVGWSWYRDFFFFFLFLFSFFSFLVASKKRMGVDGV